MARSNLISAARRHLRDAQHLLAAGPDQSIDQALHLAGFGPECARKGAIDEDLADRALGHTIEGEGDVVVDFLLSIDTGASRYGLDRGQAQLPLWAAHWRPERRYDATGAAAQLGLNVPALVEETRRFVDGLVADLWSDGALPPECLQ